MNNASCNRRLRATLCLLACLVPGCFTAAQNPGRSPIRKHFEFSGTDFIRARIAPSMRIRYSVGEPVVVPIILSNHTRFPITVVTNFNPRSQLHVIIRQEGKPSRILHGAYQAGMYTPQEYFLYPFDEFQYELVVWGDVDEPSGLVFPEPGEYSIEFTQDINVTEGNFQGVLKIGTVTIQLDPIPPAMKSFVQTLIDDKAAISLQHMKTPPGWEQKLPAFIKTLPRSPVAPYLYLAYADMLQLEWQDHQNEIDRAKALADASLFYYQMAAKSDSAYKMDAYGALLQFLDRLGAARPAAQIARELLANAPRDRRGKIGLSPASRLLKKYVPNLDEIDPVKYWDLLQ